jgi:hypothetical protein
MNIAGLAGYIGTTSWSDGYGNRVTARCFEIPAPGNQPAGLTFDEELNERTTLAGLPTATEYGGTSRVTTEPAPITAPSPIVTPFKILTLNPTQALFPMTTGACAMWSQFF